MLRVREADRELEPVARHRARNGRCARWKRVGNYGEMFERNLGRDSPLGLERGLNQPWNRGGILYAPPLQ